jgi:hypothetical protein
MKNNLIAILCAWLLSRGLYSFVITNPSFLQADIQWAINTNARGDVFYHIKESTLVVKAWKNYFNIESLSALISYDPAKISLIKESLKGLGDLSIAYEDGSAQVTLTFHKNTVNAWEQLFRLWLQWSDIWQVVVNDVVLTFQDGSSDVVSVGVEN